MLKVAAKRLVRMTFLRSSEKDWKRPRVPEHCRVDVEDIKTPFFLQDPDRAQTMLMLTEPVTLKEGAAFLALTQFDRQMNRNKAEGEKVRRRSRAGGGAGKAAASMIMKKMKTKGLVGSVRGMGMGGGAGIAGLGGGSKSTPKVVPVVEEAVADNSARRLLATKGSETMEAKDTKE